MNAQFLRTHWRVIGLVVTACVAVFLLAQLPSTLYRVAMGEPEYREYDRQLAEARVREHALHHERDSLAVIARSARIVYVTKRREAVDAIAALPPATITADSITLPQGTFPIAFPVAAYIGQLQLAVAKSAAMIPAADTAITTTVAVQEKSDSLSSASSAVAEIAVAQVEQHRPGFLSRTWNAVKVPLAATGGFLLGVVVARAVP